MSDLVEHFFRHEYGRLVAVLSCRRGFNHLENVEDAAQAALLAALERWTTDGVPDDPSAWLFRVASNHLAGEFRKENRRQKIVSENKERLTSEGTHDRVLPLDERDDLLTMLCACCHESIPVESSLVFALKTLCGFDTREIAIRLFTTESNVQKRLSRARTRLRDIQPSLDLSTADYQEREHAVLRVLYLMFTEGHLTSDADVAIRAELCDDAIRLAHIAAERDGNPSPALAALIALMLLHTSRADSRLDEFGRLLLLEEQDRGLWDRAKIREGMVWLERSAIGDTFSRYHAEAGIAAEHCLAPSYSDTNWERITDCYAILENSTNSPIHRLNRAIAVAEWQDPTAGLRVLDGFDPPTWLIGSYQWAAVLADLHGRAGNLQQAKSYREAAFKLAPTQPIRLLMEKRFNRTTVV